MILRNMDWTKCPSTIRHVVFLFLLCIGHLNALGQKDLTPVDEGIEAIPPIQDTICEFPEEIAVYPGGNDSLYKFIKRNINYPKSAKEAGIEGKVYVKFIVNELGQVYNPVVLRGIPGAKMLDAEAIRIVKLFQFEKAARMHGKPVKSPFICPIYFKLD
jgi:periplasmic protein TonB